jgi:hypothetical protein
MSLTISWRWNDIEDNLDNVGTNDNIMKYDTLSM